MMMLPFPVEISTEKFRGRVQINIPDIFIIEVIFQPKYYLAKLASESEKQFFLTIGV